MRTPLMLLGGLMLVGCHRSPVGVGYSDIDEPIMPHGISKNPSALPLIQITMIRRTPEPQESSALTLEWNGNATFDGEPNSVRKGKYSASFDRTKIANLTKLMKESHFTDFDSYYGDKDTTAGEVTISVMWDGLRKTVIDRGGAANPAPKELKALEALMESMTAHSIWRRSLSSTQIPAYSPESDTIQQLPK